MKNQKGIVQIFQWSTAILLILFLSTSCATKRYWGPSMGRSADSQSTPADALEKALKLVSFDLPSVM